METNIVYYERRQQSGRHRSVVASVSDRYSEVSKFEIQSRNHVHY